MKKALSAVFVCLWFMGQWAMAQATSSIEGSVKDSSGAPVFGAIVIVEGADGHRTGTPPSPTRRELSR
jgi:hypothetical protein